MLRLLVEMSTKGMIKSRRLTVAFYHPFESKVLLYIKMIIGVEKMFICLRFTKGFITLYN